MQVNKNILFLVETKVPIIKIIVIGPNRADEKDDNDCNFNIFYERKHSSKLILLYVNSLITGM